MRTSWLVEIPDLYTNREEADRGNSDGPGSFTHSSTSDLQYLPAFTTEEEEEIHCVYKATRVRAVMTGKHDYLVNRKPRHLSQCPDRVRIKDISARWVPRPAYSK